MEPVIDHIQVTVRDVRAAEAFYDQLMPLLGFVPMRKGKATIAAHDFEVVEYQHPRLAFAITSPRAAFAHVELQRIGATIVAPPREYPEYTPPGYYAVFFKDPDGLKYEVVHAPAPTPAPTP